jgi:hypothetical protein
VERSRAVGRPRWATVPQPRPSIVMEPHLRMPSRLVGVRARRVSSATVRLSSPRKRMHVAHIARDVTHGPDEV